MIVQVNLPGLLVATFEIGIAPNLLAIAVLCAGALMLLGGVAALTGRSGWIQAIGIVTAALAAFVGAAAPESRLAIWGIAGACVLTLLLLPHLELHDPSQRPEASALLLLASGGAIALATGADLLQMAIGLETLSLSAAVLVAMAKEEAPLEAAFKYFVLSTVSFAAVIYGIGLIYLATGSLALPNLASAPPAGVRGILAAGTVLVGLGFIFKLSAVPLHWAALDAYTSAAPGIAGFVMAVSKLAAVVALGRLVVSAGVPVTIALATVGILTIIWGTFGAFAQTDLRRLLAYSAVAHGGFLALALGSGVEGARAAAFYAIVYGAMAILVFASISGRSAGPLPLDRLADEPFSRVRFLGLTLGLFSLAGIPPTPGFWAKLAVLLAAWHFLGPIAALIAAAGGVASALYYLRPIPDVFARLRSPAPLPAATSPAVLVATAVVVLFGIIPGAAWALVRMMGGG